jgi:DNA-binding transcriptional MerR regulator
MFKIGEFSRMSRVSVRMLRHYDQLGLLTPSQTDRFTNYRYYSADQLPRLNRILALRDLGFSLEQIGNMLDEDLSPEQLLGMLKLKRAEIELQMQMEQTRMDRLEARIRQLGNASMAGSYDVILREVEPVLVATLREVAADDERIHLMFNELETYVAQYEQARADKPPLAIYYDGEYREQDIDAELAVPLNYSIPESDAVRVRETPRKSNVACVVHAGSYSSLYQAYNALLGWIETNHYRMAGPIIEVYLRYGAETLGFDLPPTFLESHSNQYVTELQLEVEKG